MKRRLFVLGALLAAAALAYGVSQWYFMRHGQHDPPPSTDPLAWIQQELHVDDATLAKVRALHESYQPTCGKMCMSIASANARVRSLLEQSRSMTPELSEAIREAQLRQADCRTAMLRHIYDTAALLPPEEARGYLRIVTARLVEDGLCLDDVTGKKP
jgi:hypothetical protein